MGANARHLNGSNGASIAADDYLRLFEALSPLIGSTCLDELSVGASRLIADLLGADACSVMLYDPKRRVLRMRAATHVPEAEWGAIRIEPGEGLVGAVFKFRDSKPELLRSSADFKRHNITPSSRYGPPTCLVAPLRIEKRTRGVVNVARPRNGKPFTAEHARILEAACGLIAAGIKNAEDYMESVMVHNRLQEILENLHIGVVAFDDEMRVTHVNQRFRDLLLEPGTRVKGRKLKKVIEPPLYYVCKRLIQDALERKTVSQDRITLVLNNEELALEITASPAQCSETRHCEALLMIEDVGQDEEVKRLREADSIKGGFLRTISHELRTPLTVIRGTIPLIKGCGDSINDSSGRMLQKVEQLLKSNVNRLSGVVNTILDVVEIDSGSLRLNCCPIDMNEIIREETDRLSEAAEKKGIRWAFGLDEDLGPVPGDRQRLGQALHELFDNAIKFSPPAAPINVRTSKWDGSVSVWIGNYGEPIAKKKRDEIFEKFYQLDQSTTREAGGVGLGLYLARNVALLHRGTLEVIDGEKGETVFLLKIPLEQPSFAARPMEDESVSAPTG